jgi:phage-related protein
MQFQQQVCISANISHVVNQILQYSGSANHRRLARWNLCRFFAVGREIVVLHSFIKKTQETPYKELAIARKRLKEVRNG